MKINDFKDYVRTYVRLGFTQKDTWQTYLREKDKKWKCVSEQLAFSIVKDAYKEKANGI